MRVVDAVVQWFEVEGFRHDFINRIDRADPDKRAKSYQSYHPLRNTEG